MVDWDDPEMPISWQANLLGINRSSLYYKPVQPSLEEVTIKHRIDEIYTKFPFLGSRKIAEILQNKGVNINRKRVQRHMREMGIQAIYPGPNLSKRNLQHRVYPYLLKGVNITRPNCPQSGLLSVQWPVAMTWLTTDGHTQCHWQ